MAVKSDLPPISEAITGGQYLNPAWYAFFETLRHRTGGDNDNVQGANDAAGSAQSSADAAAENANTRAPKSLTISFGNGLSGSDHDLSGDFTIDTLKDLGWTASTGTPSKGAYATYAGQVVSVGYVQAEAQATDNAVKAVSQRLKAIEDALRANEAIN
jgi:hypothetical protein